MTGRHGMGTKRGPYGTNEGDIWLATGSPIQDRLDQEHDDGRLLVHEMMVKDGVLGEAMYVLVPNDDTRELMEQAKEGHERYVAQRASQN